MSQKKNQKLESASIRFNTKVKTALKEEINIRSWEVWIEPLEVIDFENNVLTLFHDFDPIWVSKHYGARIHKLLNAGAKEEITVEITNKKEG